MEIEYALVQGVGVFTPRGSLDYSSTLKLMESVNSQSVPLGIPLLLDLGDVDLVNSAGASILEILVSEAKKREIRIGFCNVRGFTREILENFPIMRREDFFPTREEAFQALALSRKNRT
jgi:anti-anti-sigma regulatory factor